MIKGKTKNGFSYEINEKVLDDWDVVTMLDNVRRNKTSMAEINALFEALISREAFAKLKDAVRERNEDGIVNYEAMVEELKDILSNEKIKNYHSSHK